MKAYYGFVWAADATDFSDRDAVAGKVGEEKADRIGEFLASEAFADEYCTKVMKFGAECAPFVARLKAHGLMVLPSTQSSVDVGVATGLLDAQHGEQIGQISACCNVDSEGEYYVLLGPNFDVYSEVHRKELAVVIEITALVRDGKYGPFEVEAITDYFKANPELLAWYEPRCASLM